MDAAKFQDELIKASQMQDEVIKAAARIVMAVITVVVGIAWYTWPTKKAVAQTLLTTVCVALWLALASVQNDC